MSTERQPIIEDSQEEEPEPQPSTESAGGVRPPGRIGSGLQDDEDGGGMPPIEPPSRTPSEGGGEVSIEDLNLSMRAHNVLRRSGILTLDQIVSTEPDRLLALRNFGMKCLDEVSERVSEMIDLGFLYELDETRLVGIRRWLDVAKETTGQSD